MALESTGPDTLPHACNCNWTWDGDAWHSTDNCSIESGMKPVIPHPWVQGMPPTQTTACVDTGGGGPGPGMEDMDEGAEVGNVKLKGRTLAQLSKQAGDALKQLRALAKSGNTQAIESLHRLSELLQ